MARTVSEIHAEEQVIYDPFALSLEKTNLLLSLITKNILVGELPTLRLPSQGWVEKAS